MASENEVGDSTPLQRVLIAEMNRRNWSPADLARESGLSESYVSRLIAGKRKGRNRDTVAKLAQVFRWSAAELSDHVWGDALPGMVAAHPGADGLATDSNLTHYQRQELIRLYWLFVTGRPHPPEARTE